MARDSQGKCARAHALTAVPTSAPSVTGSPLSTARQAAAELASTLFDRAIRNCGASEAQVASALEVSRSRVRNWGDPDDESAFTVRDLIALQRCMPSLYSEIVTALAELSGVRAYERQRRDVARIIRDARTALDRAEQDLKGDEP